MNLTVKILVQESPVSMQSHFFSHFLPGGPGSGSLGKSRAGTRVTRYQDKQTKDSIGKDEHPEK